MQAFLYPDRTTQGLFMDRKVPASLWDDQAISAWPKNTQLHWARRSPDPLPVGLWHHCCLVLDQGRRQETVVDLLDQPYTASSGNTIRIAVESSCRIGQCRPEVKALLSGSHYHNVHRPTTKRYTTPPRALWSPYQVMCQNEYIQHQVQASKAIKG